MKKIRPTSVANKFYPAEKKKLLAFFEEFSQKDRHQYDYSSRAIIVPHAGYVYSGALAYEAFGYLSKNAQNVFVIAPAHYIFVEGIAISSADLWETPLGEIEVNQQINQFLQQTFGADFNDKAIEPEHSLEVQIPFVKYFLPEAKIVPILVGDYDFEKISKIISHFWDDEGNVFIISSDLSHFHHDNDAKKIDRVTAEMIETQDTTDFNPHQACGYLGILGLVDFAKKNNFSLIRVNLQNSSVTSGDKNKVVGYGSWFLHEGTKEKFVKDNFSQLLLEISHKSILSGLETGKPLQVNTSDHPEVLQQSGASFVTLELQGELKGCIGSIIANRSLIEDIAHNAFASAFLDTRFSALTRKEFEQIDIAISLLSAPYQMKFKDEADLLSQIVPNVDGIIIKDGAYKAVYLPSVWEQLPDKKLFLNSLKQKAGLSLTYFSKTFEAFRFRTEYIKK